MQRIGEPTELALRVLAEKVGLPQSNTAADASTLALAGHPPSATGTAHPSLHIGGQPPPLLPPQHSAQEFVCNRHWQRLHPRTGTLDFARDRKMMSVISEAEHPDGNSRQQQVDAGCDQRCD